MTAQSASDSRVAPLKLAPRYAPFHGKKFAPVDMVPPRDEDEII
jgi:hypothetical protein